MMDAWKRAKAAQEKYQYSIFFTEEELQEQEAWRGMH